MENIDDYILGEVVIDKDNTTAVITGKTSSSVQVYIRAKSKKGVDSNDFLPIKDFAQRFKKQQV